MSLGADQFTRYHDGETDQEHVRGRLEKLDDAIKAACQVFDECVSLFSL